MGDTSGQIRESKSKWKPFQMGPKQQTVCLETWHGAKTHLEPGYGLHCKNMAIPDWITIVNHLKCVLRDFTCHADSVGCLWSAQYKDCLKVSKVWDRRVGPIESFTFSSYVFTPLPPAHPARCLCLSDLCMDQLYLLWMWLHLPPLCMCDSVRRRRGVVFSCFVIMHSVNTFFILTSLASAVHTTYRMCMIPCKQMCACVRWVKRVIADKLN